MSISLPIYSGVPLTRIRGKIVNAAGSDFCDEGDLSVVVTSKQQTELG